MPKKKNPRSKNKDQKLKNKAQKIKNKEPKPKKKEPSVWDDFYTKIDGVSSVKAGLASLPLKVYASDDYQSKKKKSVVIGGLHRCVYAPFFVDFMPTILVMKAEPQYNTVLALNLRYIPPKLKTALLDYVLKSNAMRIRAKRPIIVDYGQLKRPFPWVSKIIRRYKLIALGIIENIPLIGWPSVAKESSKFSTIYKTNVK